jgi:hypothetical protein
VLFLFKISDNIWLYAIEIYTQLLNVYRLGFYIFLLRIYIFYWIVGVKGLNSKIGAVAVLRLYGFAEMFCPVGLGVGVVNLWNIFFT